jgi:capsular polysaccharide export protein
VNPWSLIELVDTVYVVTSQFGLEALMAGKRVVCFGVPFYAGWGLTDDRQPMERRQARPTIEQLFAAVYFDYSRYISPETKREVSFEDAVAWIDRQRRVQSAGQRAEQ